MPTFADALNGQIGHEFAASQQYIAIAVHYDAENLPQLAAHFYRQAVEERNHAMIMVQYLLDADKTVQTPGVDAPQNDFSDVVAPVALALALRSPGATVWALDVNERALDLTRRNAEALGLHGVRATSADGIPDDLRFDLIWSNPPIRVGKAVLHELLRTWLPRLTPDGVAQLVVQRNLGSDSLQRWIGTELEMPCTRLTSSKGFRVLEVRQP